LPVAFLNDPYNQTLWLMHSDGTNRHLIYTNHRYLEHPTFTPDGRQILFHEADGNGVGDILLIHVDGTHRQHIASTR